MTTNTIDVETEVAIESPSQSDALSVKTHTDAAKFLHQQTLPNVDSEEYKVLYLPTMVGVYTSRHQRMPASDESLREHVFGIDGQSGCDACREETEFLVEHQKKFVE